MIFPFVIMSFKERFTKLWGNPLTVGLGGVGVLIYRKFGLDAGVLIVSMLLLFEAIRWRGLGRKAYLCVSIFLLFYIILYVILMSILELEPPSAITKLSGFYSWWPRAEKDLERLAIVGSTSQVALMRLRFEIAAASVAGLCLTMAMGVTVLRKQAEGILRELDLSDLKLVVIGHVFFGVIFIIMGLFSRDSDIAWERLGPFTPFPISALFFVPLGFSMLISSFVISSVPRQRL
jgi:hypothetical protein